MKKIMKSSRDQWLNFALEVLVNHGPEQLKIVPLCELKGVTKGSFYHHFKNRSVFIESLMSHWYHTTTLAFIEQANTHSSAIERLQKLDQVIAGNNIDAEKHIRAWSLKEAVIEPHLEKIDQQRREYLAQCYVELGLSPLQANDVALIAYANFLGMQQIQPAPSIDEILRVTAMASKAFLLNIPD